MFPNEDKRWGKNILGQHTKSAHPWKLEEEEEEEEEEERIQMMYDILKTKKHQTKQRYMK